MGAANAWNALKPTTVGDPEGAEAEAAFEFEADGLPLEEKTFRAGGSTTTMLAADDEKSARLWAIAMRSSCRAWCRT
jgi:hypothetical protein